MSENEQAEWLSVTGAVALAAEAGHAINPNVITSALRRGVIVGNRVGKNWLADRVSFMLWLARYKPYKRASILEK